MSGWVELIKLPLYRVFIPVAVGVVFVFLLAIGKINAFSIEKIYLKILSEYFNQTKISSILEYFNQTKSSENQTKNNIKTENNVETKNNIEIILPNFITALAILAILFVIGEVFSMIGELIVNSFFCYCPVETLNKNNENNENNDYLMEKIFPCSNKWLSYEDFVKVVGSEGAGEVSEVHFVMSRFFAGLMAVSLAMINILFPVIIATGFSISVIIYRMCMDSICSIVDKFENKRFMCILLCILFIIGVFVVSLLLKLLINKIIISILFAIFFFIASLYYRSHANLLNLAVKK